MPTTDRLHVLTEILRTALLPALHVDDGAAAERFVDACSAGGARAVALEVRDPTAARLFAEVAARVRNRTPMILGAAAVADGAGAEAAIDAGAVFVWGAGFDERVARLCNRRRVVSIPTCADASEIMRAEELGAEIVALRVGKADGPGAAGALLRASPRSRLLVADRQPLTAERTQAWFDAGVAVLGAGPEALGVDPAGGAAAVAGAPDAVRAAIARVRGWVRRARGEKLFQSVEHVGLYEHRDANASDIIRKVWDEAWYRDTFEWDVEEGRAYYFVAGDGPGRIEIMKVGKTDRCHLAIKVADLDEATAYLKTKGIDLVPPETRPDGRRIFFTVTDPAGNILHMLP